MSVVARPLQNERGWYSRHNNTVAVARRDGGSIWGWMVDVIRRRVVNSERGCTLGAKSDDGSDWRAAGE